MLPVFGGEAPKNTPAEREGTWHLLGVGGVQTQPPWQEQQ